MNIDIFKCHYNNPARMEQNQINHELDGYKFSFSRFNPYLQNHPITHSSLIPESLPRQILIQTPQFSSKRSPTQLDRTNAHEQRNSTQLQGQQGKSGVPKYTKQMFYKKADSDKNKVLMDLYLRKTRFQNLKSKPVQSKTQSISQCNDSQTKKSSQQKINHQIHPENDQSLNYGHPHMPNLNIKKMYKAKGDTKKQIKDLVLEKSEKEECLLLANLSNFIETKQAGFEVGQTNQQVQVKKNCLSSITPKPHIVQNYDQIRIIVTPKAQFYSSLRIQQEQPDQTIANDSEQTQCYNQRFMNINSNDGLNQESMSKILKSPKYNDKKSIIYKIFRNHSQSKFTPYLVSSPRRKRYQSGTAPVVAQAKFQNSKSLLKLYPLEINPMQTIEASSSKKPNKNLHRLKIKTQNCEQHHSISTKDQYSDLINLQSLNSPQSKNFPRTDKKLQPLKLQNIKQSSQQLSGKRQFGLLGQIKYKSPRMILSSRNHLFKGRNNTQKMKLFTEEEQTKIIQEFYSQQNQQEKAQNEKGMRLFQKQQKQLNN